MGLESLVRGTKNLVSKMQISFQMKNEILHLPLSEAKGLRFGSE
jgi:hypothetical protein